MCVLSEHREGIRLPSSVSGLAPVAHHIMMPTFQSVFKKEKKYIFVLQQSTDDSDRVEVWSVQSSDKPKGQKFITLAEAWLK